MTTISEGIFQRWVNQFIKTYINKQINPCGFKAGNLIHIYNSIAHSFKQEMDKFYTEWSQAEFSDISLFIDKFLNGKSINIASEGAVPYTCDLSKIKAELIQFLTNRINTYQKQMGNVRATKGADFGNTPFSYEPLTCNGPCAALLSDLLSWMDRVHDSFGARKSSESTPIQELSAQRYVWEVVFLGIKNKYNNITLDDQNKREAAAHKTLEILFEKLEEIIYDNDIPVYKNLNDHNIKSILAITVDDPRCIFHYCSIISFAAYHSAIPAIEQGILISAKFGKTPYEMLHELQIQDKFTLIAESRDKGHGETLLLLKTPVKFLIQIMNYMYEASQEEEGYIIISDFYNDKKTDRYDEERLIRLLKEKKINLKNIRYPSFKYTMPTTVSNESMDVKNIDILTQLTRLKEMRGGNVEAMATTDVDEDHTEKKFPRDYFNNLEEGTELKAADLATQPCQLSIDMHSGGNVGHKTVGMAQGLSSVMPFNMTPLIGPTNKYGQAMPSNAYCNDPAGEIYKGGFADTIKFQMRDLVSFENKSKLPMDLKKNSKNQTPDFLSNATNYFTKLGVYAPYAEYTHTTDSDSGVEMPYKMGFKLKMNYEYEDINILLALLSSNPDKLNVLKGITEKKCGNGKEIPRGNCSHNVECSCLREKSDDIKKDFQSYMDCWSGKNGNFLFETSGELTTDGSDTQVIMIYNTDGELDNILAEHTSNDDKPIPPILKIKISANGKNATVNYNYFKIDKEEETDDASMVSSSDEESVDTSSEEVENHGYLLLYFDSDDGNISEFLNEEFNVEVVQPMTATMIKDHKQAKVNWCPCHGAFINNFVDIVIQSEDLTDYIRKNRIDDWPKFLRNIAQIEEAGPDTWEEDTDIMYDIPLDKSELMQIARNLGLPTKGKKLELAKNIIAAQTDPTISIVDANNIFLKTEKNISEVLKEFANKSSVNGVSFQRHLKASGTIGDSNAFNLDNIAENGMGICNKSCACKGLCLGNKIWAAFGLNILYIMDKSSEQSKILVGDMIKNELQNSNSIIAMPFFALINIIFQDDQQNSVEIVQDLQQISTDYLGPNNLTNEKDQTLPGLVQILLNVVRSSIQTPMTIQFNNLLDRMNIFEKSELTFNVDNIKHDNIQVKIEGIVVTIQMDELFDDGPKIPIQVGNKVVIPGIIIAHIHNLIQNERSNHETLGKYFGKEKLTPEFIVKINQLDTEFKLLDREYNDLLSEENSFEDKRELETNASGADPMLYQKSIFLKTLANRKSAIENVVGGYSSKATEYAVIDGSAVLHANLEEEFNETLENWWRMYVPGNRVIARFPSHENFYPGVITGINDEDVSIKFDGSEGEHNVSFNKIHTMPKKQDGTDDVVAINGWQLVTDKTVEAFPKKKYGYPRPKDIAKFIREKNIRKGNGGVNSSLSSESSEEESPSQGPVEVNETINVFKQTGGLDIEPFNDMIPYIWFLMKTIAFDVNNNPTKILHDGDKFNPDKTDDYKIDLTDKMYLIGEQGAANLRNIIYIIQHWRPKIVSNTDSKPESWRYLYTPKQIIFAKKRLIMAITAVKTGGDLHQLTLPLQNEEKEDKLALALMLEGTGDFMGTGFQVMFQAKNNKMPQPRTFLTKRETGIGIKLPMICLKPETQLIKYNIPTNQEGETVKLKDIKDNIKTIFIKGTPSESVNQDMGTPLHAEKSFVEPGGNKAGLGYSTKEYVSGPQATEHTPHVAFVAASKSPQTEPDDGRIEQLTIQFEEKKKDFESETAQENIKTTPGQLQGWYNQFKYFDDDKILTKSAHEHDDKALKLKKEVSNLIMAILERMNESHQSTGGSKSKKRYHRRRTTIRKKKLRKAKSIKRRRKRGRKTRKNKK